MTEGDRQELEELLEKYPFNVVFGSPSEHPSVLERLRSIDAKAALEIEIPEPIASRKGGRL